MSGSPNKYSAYVDVDDGAGEAAAADAYLAHPSAPAAYGEADEGDVPPHEQHDAEQQHELGDGEPQQHDEPDHVDEQQTHAQQLEDEEVYRQHQAQAQAVQQQHQQHQHASPYTNEEMAHVAAAAQAAAASHHGSASAQNAAAQAAMNAAFAHAPAVAAAAAAAGEAAGPSSTGGSIAGGDEYEHHQQQQHDESPRKGTGGSAKGSKRSRVHFSCTECHRRKQKCDRKMPCNHCVARKVPERCKMFQPGEDADDVANRLQRLERDVQDGFGRLAQMLELVQQGQGYVQQPAMQQQPAQQQAPQYAAAQYLQQQQSLLPPPALVPAARYTAMQTQPGPSSDVAGDETNDGGRLSPKTGTFAASGSMRIDTIIDNLSGQTVGAYKDPYRSLDGQMFSGVTVDEAMSDMGAMLSVSYSLCAALPPRHLAEALLDHWYEDLNWLRLPIAQASTRREFDELWASGPTLTPANISTYAVLVLLLALATLSFPRSEVFPEDPRNVRLSARRLHFAGRRALLVSSMLPPAQNLNHVLAWTLSGRFCLIDGRIAESWTAAVNAVSASWALGLHRDGSQHGLSPEVSEARRLVWGGTVWLERVLAMNLGRPTMIDDSVCDAKAPSTDHVSEDLYPRSMAPSLIGYPQVPPGVKTPTILDYCIHRHELNRIVGRVINVYQYIPTKHYSDVLAIEAELEAFTRSLPYYFQSPLDESANMFGERKADASWPLWLFTHLFMIHSDIAFVRGALHRPYLIRSGAGKSGARFMPSRRAAIRTAFDHIALRRDFRETIKARFSEKSLERFRTQLSSQKYFSSCLTLGIACLMEPFADDALAWRTHLEDYVQTQRESRDGLRDREMHIIELFIARFDDVRAGKHQSRAKRERDEAAGDAEHGAGKVPRRQTDEEGDAHATAGLLLGLGRGADGSTQPAAGQGAQQPAYNDMISSLAASGSPATTATPGTTTRAEEAESAQALLENWWRAEFEKGGSVLHDEVNGDGLAGFDRHISTAAPPLNVFQQQQQLQLQQQQLQQQAAALQSAEAARTVGAEQAAAPPRAAPAQQQAASGVQLSTLPAPTWSTQPGGVESGAAAPSFDQSFWNIFMDKIKPATG